MEKIPVVEDYTPPFAKDGKFHVRLTEGRFQNLRRFSSWPMIALFFGLAWVQYDGQPWLLFSFEQHRIILFGNTLSWHDLPLLAGLMIAGSILLFFMAVALGRVWCGFSCPQSIWTWLFIRIEQTVEGRANERAKYELRSLRGNRLMRRITKHILWILLSLLTAMTFTGYFVPIRDILADTINMQLSASMLGWLSIMAILTYLNAGLVREKICLHACPYSRFQGVMFDRDTLTVSYDWQRGEPRTNQRNTAMNKTNAIKEKTGDCIDCGICVQVCPTGIDIRDGLQAACIDCGACIDACDRVMDKIGKPRGLVRFASEAQLGGEITKMVRPRLIAYGLVMLCAFSAVLYGFTDTSSLVVEVRRDRNVLFTQLDKHTICNNYLVKVEGLANQKQVIKLAIVESKQFQLFGAKQIDLTESNATWIPYRVCAEGLELPRTSLTFNFSGVNETATKETTFITSKI